MAKISCGIVYVVYGPNARKAALQSISSIRKYNNISITVIGDEPIVGENFIHFNNPGFGARWAKLNINELSDYDMGMYIDADTVVNGDISVGFDIIRDGWDFVIVPSTMQGSSAFHHLGEAEKQLMSPYQLQLQGGMFFYHKERCNEFFNIWRKEWKRWKGQDQGALVRALYTVPLRVYLLARPWNGGSHIEHLFGRARWI